MGKKSSLLEWLRGLSFLGYYWIYIYFQDTAPPKDVKKHVNKVENKKKPLTRKIPSKVPRDKGMKTKKPATKVKPAAFPKVPQPTIKAKPGIQQPGIVKSVTYYKAGGLEDTGNGGKSKYKQSKILVYLYLHVNPDIFN